MHNTITNPAYGIHIGYFWFWIYLFIEMPFESALFFGNNICVNSIWRGRVDLKSIKCVKRHTKLTSIDGARWLREWYTTQNVTRETCPPQHSAAFGTGLYMPHGKPSIDANRWRGTAPLYIDHSWIPSNRSDCRISITRGMRHLHSRTHSNTQHTQHTNYNK